MTMSRLYYTDAYLTTFHAHVVACEPTDQGYAVVLDQTAFYPTSGGQPFDTGTIDGVAVRDVQDRDDGAIVHLLAAPIAAGRDVEGSIDWPRRFDHMQQHTGQHLLSAAFDRLAVPARTESFHLGEEHATIDLSREVTPAEIITAEDQANRIVWEDREVAVRFASPEEAARLPLRKDPVRSGRLRLIDVHDYDLSACGGTHVARTGAIGLIAVSGWERLRGGTRVEFRCGRRALQRFRYWRDAVWSAQRLLSVAPHELAEAIERAQAEAKAARRTIRAQQERLAGFEASALVARGMRLESGVAVAVEALEGWDATGLKSLASAAAAVPGHAVALFSTDRPALVVVARAPDVNVHAGDVVKALTARFGGRGGGTPDLAQGGGLDAASDALVAEAHRLLRAATSAPS
jgi:alanyl-tRNA synthetase